MVMDEMMDGSRAWHGAIVPVTRDGQIRLSHREGEGVCGAVGKERARLGGAHRDLLVGAPVTAVGGARSGGGSGACGDARKKKVEESRDMPVVS